MNEATVTMTARIPAGLKGEAEAYARSVGVSLNGLLGVALRDYLDARRRMRPSVPPSPASVARLPVPVPPAGFKAPKKPRAPCPCGSGQQWRHCHGKGA